MNQQVLRERLLVGASAMGVVLTEAQTDTLMAYLQRLGKWNQAYNLTALKTPEAMLALHLLDSLSVVPHVTGQNLLDVGTGAGLPGIVLAIVHPERRFTLLDSNGKKTRFLVQVKAELGLQNVTVLKQRIEEYHPAELFDGVISRAFASLPDMIHGCFHVLRPGGIFWAMKGVEPVAEYQELPDSVKLQQVIELQVPEVEGQRHLLVLSKT